MICQFCSKEINDNLSECPFCGHSFISALPKVIELVEKSGSEDFIIENSTKKSAPFSLINELSDLFKSFTDISFLDKFFETEEEEFENAKKNDSYDAVSDSEGNFKVIGKKNTASKNNGGKASGDDKPNEIVREFYPAEKINNKKLSFKSKLKVQLLIYFLIGYTGIPAMFRTNKWFGVMQAVLFVSASVLYIAEGFWQLFLIVGYFYFIGVATLLIRISVYRRRKRNYNEILLKHNKV